MAEAFIEEVYEYARVISSLHRVVEYIRVHDDHHAVTKMDELLPEMCELCKACITSGYGKGMRLWDMVQQITMIRGDLIKMGDFIEAELLPLMKEWMQFAVSIYQETGDGYLLESGSSGFLTMKSMINDRYLHSKNDPMEEARKLVENYYEPKKMKYSVLGCGLGYHIYQLYKVSNGSVSITVYEENPRVVEYARRYGVLDWIPEEKLNIITGNIALPFLQSSDNEETGILFHLPSVKEMEDELERETIMQVYIQQSTAAKIRRNVQINFWRNIQKELPMVSELRGKEHTEEFVVVAAGPSLDDNLEVLREWQGKKNIVAVGTVFKKLLAADIRPDYVVVVDSQERTARQIDGVEKQQIPMVLDMASYWGFAYRYEGPKYLVCVPGRDELIAEYAMKNKVETWSGGSTVTSLALEFAIEFGAKKIYFIGVDLAYPDGVSHATGTLDYKVRKLDNMTPVNGVWGTMVYADRVFCVYREQIEERIAQTPDIQYYNLSKVGAHIEGAIEIEFEGE
ncbi:MAG: motility associated factor glycosyltransferase family protein [Lachnospiraceae bacterium]|nr:motility associated factor glycosyltransferase family protein [Lachnospiraceae bacterium]